MPLHPYCQRFLFIFFACWLLSCHQRSKSISFYYWKTSFHLDSQETAALRNNAVTTVYARYFDIDFLPQDTAPASVSPITWDTAALTVQIIPVVYIKNRVFERLDIKGINQLSKNVYQLATAISNAKKIATHEIQFDCDWTDGTRDNYFLFLQQYRAISKQMLVATIRLHQVKYPGRTGIPPVDHGVLMYYNMGAIGAGNSNSIYDKSIAAKYNPAIKNYPLQLDIALPIFAWGLQVRDGRVIKLLNKMNFLHFENDSNFTPLAQHRYLTKHACFHGGYYFKENDQVKTEYVAEKDLLGIVEQVNKYSNHRIGNLIYYDLDKENLALYDEKSFRTIMDHLD